MSALDLNAIKARLVALAPAPWTAYDQNEGSSHAPLWAVANDAYFNPHEDTEGDAFGVTLESGGLEDAQFIASAREGVPALIAEVERLRARVAELEFRPVSAPPARRGPLPPAAIWGSNALEPEDQLGIPGLTADEAHDFTSGAA